MISDDTLREGMQAPGIAFTVNEKIKLATMISDAGMVLSADEIIKLAGDLN